MKSDHLIIDWQKVCLNLRTHYKPLSAVANEVNSDYQHISRLSRGDTIETGFSVGVRLLDLHHDHCGWLKDSVIIS